MLQGHAVQGAAGIRRRSTAAKFARSQRANANECANTWSTRQNTSTTAPTSSGWPIAAGIIEGACRYLVADRMGYRARRSVTGAEATNLRAVRVRAKSAKVDFDTYWQHYVEQEQRRIH